MTGDEKLLWFGYMVFWGSLLVLVALSKNWKRLLIINVSIHLLYSSLFLYLLKNYGEQGSSLLWFVALLFFIGVHWLIMIIYILIKRYKSGDYEKT